jgi:hypothetical protein
MNTVKISTNAVTKRIRRKLAHDGQSFHTYREWPTGPWSTDLGAFYVTDQRNCIVGAHLELEPFARGLGVLHDSESVMD